MVLLGKMALQDNQVEQVVKAEMETSRRAQLAGVAQQAVQAESLVSRSMAAVFSRGALKLAVLARMFHRATVN